MVRGARFCAISSAVLVVVLGGWGTPLANAQCVGDCDGNGSVTAAEVASGVQIGLLVAEDATCPAYPSGAEIEDLVLAVNHKLEGCPPTPTATATATPTSTPTATATNTPGGVSNAVAGGAAVVAKSLGGIPSLVTAIVTGLTRGGTTESLDQGGGAGACPLGGTASRTCTANGNAIRIELGLDTCALATPDGSLTLDTVLPISLDAPGFCSPTVLVPPINATADLFGFYRNPQDELTLTTRATLPAVVVRSLEIPNPTPVCVVAGTELTVTGSLSSVLPNDGGGAVLNFLQAEVDVDIATYNSDCVPVEYTLTFNGPAKVSDTSAISEPVDVEFDDLVVTVDARTSPTTLQMEGGLNFGCVTGAITVDTIEPLTSTPGALCPTAGILALGTPEGPARVRYDATGRVDIDFDNDGTFDNTFPSCIDPMLFLCPQP